MKKKVFPFAVLAVTVILSVIFALTAFAKDSTPSLTFYGQSLSLKDSVEINFYVTPKNITKAAETVKLLVWDTEQYGDNAYTMASGVTEGNYISTSSGRLIFSVGVIPRKYAENIYVRAYANVGGKEYYSPVMTYSVLQYVYNKLGYTGTATTDKNLTELCHSLLDYGAKSQKYFNYNTDRLPTDRFVQIKTVDGVLSSSVSTALYKAGDTVTLVAQYRKDGLKFDKWVRVTENGSVDISNSPICDFTVPDENETYSCTVKAEYRDPNPEFISNGDGTCRISGIGGCDDGSFVIPTASPSGDTVTGIGAGAFENCVNITSITIPNTVTDIGDRAFRGCTGLTEIRIPSSVTSIGIQIFENASNLKTVYYDSQYSSADNRFMSNIDKVVFGGSVITQNCCIGSSVKEIVVLDTVKYIYSHAFENLKSLTSLELPESITSIGFAMLRGCVSLKSLTVPNSVTSIGDKAFYGCSSLTSVIIPGNVKSIPNYAFAACTGLTSVTVSDGVAAIGDFAFENCAGLKSVTLPDSITSIGEKAFFGCTSLTSVVIPEGVTTIGEYAFGDCNDVLSVFAEADSARPDWSAAWYGGGTVVYDCHDSYDGIETVISKINNTPSGTAVKAKSDVFLAFDPSDHSFDCYYNHYPEITKYNDLFVISWCSGKRNEDDFGQYIMVSYSKNLTEWSEPEILFDPVAAGNPDGAFINSGFAEYNGILYAYGYICKTTGAKPGITSTLSSPTYYCCSSTDGKNWGDMEKIDTVNGYNSKQLLSGRYLTFGRGSMTCYTDEITAGSYLGLGWARSYFDMTDALDRGAGTLMESSFYQTDGGTVFMMFRTNTAYNWCSVSCDGGQSWSKIYKTGFTDAISKSRYGRLPDGRIYYVGNPDYDPAFTRNPLMLCVSDDGINFAKQYILRNEKDYTMQVDGLFKEGEFGYPCVITDDEYMYVLYTKRKETLEITRISLADI